MPQSSYLRVVSRSLTSTRVHRYQRALLSFVVAAVMAGVSHSGLAQLQYAPTLTTDRSAYAAGDEINIAGTGFAANETVALTATHDDGVAEPGAGHEPWIVTADEAGNVSSTWTIDAGDAVGRRFVINAAGVSSGAVRSAVLLRAPMVGTDSGAYVAGDRVTIMGRDFSAGETVTVQVLHADGTAEPGMGHEPSVGTVEIDGTFQATWSPSGEDLSGPQFAISVTGDVSGEVASTSVLRVANLTSDKADYQPGETVMIAGRGFSPNELVTLQVTHADGRTDGNGHAPFEERADASGNVTAAWFVNHDALGFKFLVTGQGQTSGVSGNATFWDAGPFFLSTLGVASTENFDTLATTGTANAWADDTTLPGWFSQQTIGTGPTVYRADSGGSNAGAIYSWGVAGVNPLAERAFGSVASGTPGNFLNAIRLVNNTGSTITSLAVGFTGEQWRQGGCQPTPCTPAAQKLDFQYQIANAGVITDANTPVAGWIDHDLLDFTSPQPGTSTAAALDGNAAANRTALSATLSLTVNAGQEIWLRWRDTNDANNDHGLAIDDLSVTPNGTPAAPSLSIADVSVDEGNAGTTLFDFVVNLSVPAGAGGVTFDIATSDGTAQDDTPATEDNDYVAKSLTGQSIPEGSSTYTFSVLVNGDATTDPDETFFVDVSNVTGADLNDGRGLATILNDDATDVCAAPFTPIHQIQGSGLSAAVTGNVTTQGVVVGDFEGTAAASGFYLQDPAGDGDAATSDGIFVFTGASNLVTAGQVVRVTGFARERFNQTTINGSNSNTAAVPAANIATCGAASVAATDVSLPFANSDSPERYEGMLVRFPQSLVIAEYFNYERFGEIVLAMPLSGETRPYTGTAIDEPGAAANARTAANALRRITLDDAQSAQNPPTLRHPNGDPFTLSNSFRGGDTVANAVGVLAFDFSLYRIVPTGPANYTAVNSRPAAPEPVGGTVRVAAMNTLNFFVTLDTTANDNGPGPCGGNANLDCRGADADQPLEFTRQRDKLLTALSGLNADIIGLNELENTPGVEPLESITAGLPGYAYINTGTIGTDAIKVGLIYRSAAVTPVGSFETLDSTDDPRFIDNKSRPSLAQTFTVNATGAKFTVAVNHFKSKGSDCLDVDDPDLLDGQGNCSQTRRAAAEALVDWLATDPTASGDPDFLIVGDLNSYAKEDTIDEILEGADDVSGTSDDFTNLIGHFQGADAYSYTFDGQAGYLDHALASASLFAQITGATEWHINSDEPDILDYDTTFKPPSQDALYEVNPYRTSDHDPVVVGLTPNAPPVVAAGGPYSVGEGGSIMLAASGSDPNGGILAYAWDLDDNGSFETTGQSVTFSAALLDGPVSASVKVRATDPDGLSSVATATVSVTNIAPTVSASFVSSNVSCGPANSTLRITFSDPAVADTHVAVINWGDGHTQTVNAATSPLVLSHIYAGAGSYTSSVSVRDDDGDSGIATAGVTANFNTGGVLPPLNTDGTSVFKFKSTIPVKTSFTNCDGSTPANLAPSIALTMISGATPGLEINEPLSTSAADTTGVMRFSANQYIYNLATESLPDSSATYRITITVPSTGQISTVQFGLRP